MPFWTVTARPIFSGRAMAEFQNAFSGALLDADAETPEGFKAPDGGSAKRRFAVYRNNVTHSLVSALADIFPSVQSLVGEEYFRAMARVFVEANPPKSPLIFEYGRNFADFAETFAPAQNLPFLPDVARLDRLWLDAFHAADASPLNGAELGAVAPEKLAEIRFARHPAARLFASDYSAVTLVSRSRQKTSLEGFNPMAPEFGLVTRPEFDPYICNLPQGAFVFTEALFADKTLGEAIEMATESDTAFDLSQALTILIPAGAFSAIKHEGGTN